MSDRKAGGNRFFSLLSSCLRKTKMFFRKIYKGPWYKQVVVWIATFFVSIVLLLGAVDINFLYLFGRSPGFSDIKSPITSAASEVYSSDSVLIGRFFNENRTPVKYEDLPPHLIRTLIDTEDERFYKHHGIDFQGLFAAVKDMVGGHARGASTITQQLAKNMFRVRTQYSTGLLGKIPGVKILVMKAKEWIVAVKLEMIFSKEEILTMYFNTVDFGSNSYGIKTASRTYFGKDPQDLNYEEAATLVGLLKATSTYNPRKNPKNSTSRRNVVLTNLYDHGHLVINGKKATRAQLDSIKAIPMKVSQKNLASNYDGIAPYFRLALADYIDDLCEKGLVEGCDSSNKLDLYADGLKIYTTLDTRMQKYAEASVQKQMAVIQRNFNNHWGKTNPWQNEKHEEIPNFIEDLAKRTDAYKYYSAKYPDDPDSVTYYLNQPHKVKLFSYEGQKEEMRRLRSLSESFLSSEVIDGLDDELIRLRSDAVCLRNDISMRADTLSSLEAERAKQNALLHQDVPLLEEDEAHLAYGSYLFESGEKWVNESTPEEVLDIISSILETESAIKERDEKDREKVNSLRAEEIDALIRENILHIKALEQEKRRIDAKIEALSRENSSLEEEKNALT